MTLPDNFLNCFNSPRDAFVMFYILCKADGGVLETTLKTMCEETGLSTREMRTSLSSLCGERQTNDKQIDKQTTNKKTIITVCKSECCSVSKNEKDKQTTNKRTNKRQTKTVFSKGVDFDIFMDYFNKHMSGHAIPPIKLMTDKRRASVGARFREYGRQALADVTIKAANSDFLNGKNKTAWVADFDWIFKPNNFPKILEGNYDNKKQDGDIEKTKRDKEVVDLVNDLLKGAD